jgi:hypothetical protein
LARADLAWGVEPVEVVLGSATRRSRGDPVDVLLMRDES